MADWDWARSVNPKDPTPLHAQLERSIRVAIGSRHLRPGDQLPTVRELAVALRINANTVARVYSDLERSGVLETRRGVGSFILATAEEARSKKEHEKRLRAFATRVVGDAAAAGFTPEELVSAIRKEGVR